MSFHKPPQPLRITSAAPIRSWRRMSFVVGL